MDRYVDGFALVKDIDMFNNSREKFRLKNVEYMGEDNYEEGKIFHIFLVQIPKELIKKFRRESFVEALDFE